MILENGPSHHETWSIWCHVGIHIDFTSTLHCVGPPSVMWSALGAGSAFSTNESAWSAMVTGLQSRMWSELRVQARKSQPSKSFDPPTAVPSADGHVSPCRNLLSFLPPHLSRVTSHLVPTSTRPTYLPVFSPRAPLPAFLLASLTPGSLPPHIRCCDLS